MKLRLKGKLFKIDWDEFAEAIDKTHEWHVFKSHGSWMGKYTLKKGLTNDDFTDALIKEGHLIKEG